MTQAPPATRVRPTWSAPLVAGLCFGLAYGVTQRLISLNVGELIRFGQGFDVQVFPGTSLESLRLRFGAADSELRGRLELDQLDRQPEAQKQPEPDLQQQSPPTTALDEQPAAEAPAAPDLPAEPQPSEPPASAAPAATPLPPPPAPRP